MPLNRIQELKARIESIPEKRSRKKLVAILAEYCKKTSSAAEVISQSIERRGHARRVFTDEEFNRVMVRARSASADAKHVRGKLRENLHSVQDKKIDDRIADIVNNASRARKELNERWEQILTSRVQGFDKLVQATTKAKMRGSKILEKTLREVKSHVGAPPSSAERAHEVKADLELLIKSVKELGLEGKPGEFLKDAADGRGNPQALYEPEVRQFIADNNLWALLHVNLG